MSKIVQKLTNYKQYSDVEFNTEGPLIVYLGKNGKGKSTAIQAFEECIMAKGFVKEPIKHGETEASIFFKYTKNDGEPIQIEAKITGNNAYDITCGYIKDGKVKSISDPKKIRDIIGTYYPLTVSQALNMVASTEGRRKFISDYLLPLLGDEKQKRLETLQNNISDKKNKATEGNWYHTRTEKQRELAGIEGELKASTISEEDKTTIASKDAVVKALDKLKEEKKLHTNDSVERKNIEFAMNDLDNNRNTIISSIEFVETKYLLAFEKEKINIQNAMNTAIKDNEKKLEGLYIEEQITALDEKITRGNNKLTEISVLEKKGSNTDALARRGKVFGEVNDLNSKIEKAKEEIKLIYSNSALPSGLQINEEGLIILNGFELSENTNSTTEVKMAIIELLCKLNTSGFVNIGEYNDYDDDNKKKIFEYAKKNKLIFIGQQVNNDEEVSCITLIVN